MLHADALRYAEKAAEAAAADAEAARVATAAELMADQAVLLGLGRVLALSLCTTAHPLHTRLANISTTSISETTIMRPNPRCCAMSSRRCSSCCPVSTARGDTTILTENDSNDSKISV